MKIRKYYAKDMRQALKMVRDEQGPDAVILANRKVSGGIELLAADHYEEPELATEAVTESPVPASPIIDNDAVVNHIKPTTDSYANIASIQASEVEQPKASPQQKNKPIHFGSQPYQDEAIEKLQNELMSMKTLLQEQMSALAWGDIGKTHPLWAALLRRLGKAGLHASLARSLVEQIPHKMDLDKAWRLVMAYLSYRIRIEDENILSPNQVLAFLGQSGVGKTTTIAKLATQYITQHQNKNVILATTDSYRVGGREQLKNYARILGVSFQVIDSAEALSAMIENHLGEKLILIDTAGIPVREQAYRDQLSLLAGESSRIRTCLVVAANSQTPPLKAMPKEFTALTPDTSIITKLDETFSLGDTLSTLIEQNLKISYCCDGQRVHGDIFKPVAHQLVSQTINTMNINEDYMRSDERIEQEFGELELATEHGAVSRYEN